MFLTNVLLKNAKSKHVMVLVESLVSGHKAIKFRERAAEKLELLLFDPYIQQKVLYKEIKKIKSMNFSKHH